jgi:hypothetical protein
MAPCGPGLAQASTINVLPTLHGEVINVHSSRSYELSLFSSEADSTHGVGGLALSESSTVSINDDWPEASVAVESFRCEGDLAITDHGHIEASVSHHLSSSVNKSKKRKKTTRRCSTSGGAPRQTSSLQRPPLQGSASQNSRGHGSAKAKDRKILLDSEAGTSGALPRRIQSSFLEGRYTPSTGMDISEWQVIFEQFVDMGIIIKSEVESIEIY